MSRTILMGCYDGLPLRFTSPGVPVGRVIQLQNLSAMQGIMALPVYLLLGDPRLVLAPRPPYSVIADETPGDSRVVRLTDAPPGILPVRIKSGAGFSHVESADCSSSRGYPFYNSRLQAMGIGEDKFLLVDHAGGPLTLRLRRETPLAWAAATVVNDALDQSLVFVAAGGFSFLGGLVALVAVSAVRPGGRVLAAGVAAGGALAALHALWVVARLGNVAVTAKPLEFSWPAILNTFVLMSGSSTICLSSRKRSGRILAIALAASLAWLPETLYLRHKAASNLTAFQPRVGAAICTYNTAILSACSTVIIVALALEILIPLRRFVR